MVTLLLVFFRGEPCSSKIRNTTEAIPPSWGLLTTNEVLFPHCEEGSGKMLRGASDKLGRGMAKEHLEALRARVIECYFHLRGQVDEDVFRFKVTLEQAKSALAALVLMEFKNLEHPLTVASPTLLPSVIQGLQASRQLAPRLLSITQSRYDHEVDNLYLIYQKSLCETLENDDLLETLNYDDPSCSPMYQ